MRQNGLHKLGLFPVTAEASSNGHLCVGGCDCVELVREHGSPLYVFDELNLRSKCQEFKSEFARFYSNTLIIYASKAFLNRALALILKEEGLGLDVVSGGEMSIAQSVAFPPEKIYFHGNNKTVDELKLALSYGVGRIVVDNFYELDLVDELAGEKGIVQPVLLRLNPGVDFHAHRYTTTGIQDSKFGFPMVPNHAETALVKAMSAANLNLSGLHFHLGSPLIEMSPYQLAIDSVLRFAKEMESKYNFHLEEFSPGGGFAVRYTLDSPVPCVADYAEAIGTKLVSMVEELGLAYPRLIIETGRGIAAQAGVALYTVGAEKEITGVRKYVCVDGGMGDNIRPALYEAKYEALVANKTDEAESITVTIAGKYCESGDVLIKDVVLPPLSPGDIIAIPVNGAYSIPMASNYNMIPRPAIVMVRDGKSRLIRRRESYQDLMSLDVS